MKIFCIAKDSHIFPTKIKCICTNYVLNFNETLTNKVVNFKQLAAEGQVSSQRGSYFLFLEK